MSETLDEFIDHVNDEFSSLGLIGEFASIGANELVEGSMERLLAGEISETDAVREGLIEFELLISFAITPKAWSKPILDPEGFKMDQEFRRSVPPENEMTAQRFLETFGSDDPPLSS